MGGLRSTVSGFDVTGCDDGRRGAASLPPGGCSQELFVHGRQPVGSARRADRDFTRRAW